MISIILPIYQVESYIENCIKSICAQTYTDYEVILVNDGTKDKSIDLAERILEENLIEYHILKQKNKGVSVARNNGIKFANGEYVICVDPDDYLNKNFLQLLYDGLNKNIAKVSITNYQFVKSNNLDKQPISTYKSIILEKDIILEEFLLRKINIISPAILIEKNFLVENDLFYDEKMKFSEDVHWIWRVLLSIKKVSYESAELYNYNIRESSTMTSSGIKKIMTGYQGFLEISKKSKINENELLKKFLLSRWILGVLNASSRMLEYTDFLKLTTKLSFKLHARKLKDFPDYKVKVLSLLILINRRLFYFICKNIKN